MEPSKVAVSTTPVGDNKTIVECSVCGPVGVFDLSIHVAAMEHLAGVHNITEMKRVN